MPPKLAESSHAILVVSLDHYVIFSEGGWGRAEIEAGLREGLRRPGSDLVQGARREEGDRSRARRRDDGQVLEGGRLLVRAGGRGGLMSAMIGGWSAERRKSEVQTSK